MAEHAPLQSVEQTRHQMTVLRARLEDELMAPGSPEIRGALDDFLEMLEKLRSHCGLLQEILARSSDAVFAKDRDGRYVMINPPGAGMFGKSVEKILGQDDTALFERASAERIMAIDRVVMSTGRPRTSEETLDLRGGPITLLTTRTAWYEPPGTLRGLIGSAQDVTERRRAEQGAQVQQDRLRSLVSEIVISEEHLRQSLAADLHSGLGQDIALAKMKLSMLRASANADLGEALIQIERLVEQANRSLRAITYQLSPPSLHDLGLMPALEWLAADLSGRYDLDVRVEDDGAPAVADARIRVILFRAVRELLLNVATHAGVREAVVRLAAENGVLRVIVADEGAGFDAAETGLQGHGLFGIREQIEHVCGSMQIDSKPGRGTKVVLTAPRPIQGTAAT